MAKHCTNCGQALREGAKFCPSCGRPVVVPPPSKGGTADLVRPMSTREILINALRLYMRHFLQLLGVSVVGYGIFILVSLIFNLVLGLTFLLIARVRPELSILETVFALLLIPFEVGFATAVLTAPLTIAVSEMVVAEYDFRTVRRTIFSSRLVHLVLTVVLQSLTILLGFLLFIIPGIFLAVSYSLTTVAVMLEDKNGWAAMRRSRQLVQGFWWKAFGVLLLSVLPVSLIVAVSFGAIILGYVEREQSLILSVVIFLFVLLLPVFPAIAQVLLYYDLRSRKGAFNARTLATLMGPKRMLERL